jgi:hypothetical protein
MAEPIIIDDGGSTRIKQLTTTANMDRLLKDKGDQADGNFESGGVAACALTIIEIKRDGTTSKVGPLALAKEDMVEIFSENDQKVTVTLGKNKKVSIDLATSKVGGPDPIVEARQHHYQRRYIVSNAGPILQVVHTPDTGPATTVFTQSANTVHTLVHFV